MTTADLLERVAAKQAVRRFAQEPVPITGFGLLDSAHCRPVDTNTSDDTTTEDRAAYEHIASPYCWCRPMLDYTDRVTGASVWIHRETEQ